LLLPAQLRRVRQLLWGSRCRASLARTQRYVSAVVLIGGAAVLISTVVIAIALMVRSDVASRARATAARQAAWAEMVRAMLDNYHHVATVAASSPTPKFAVKLIGLGTWAALSGIRRDGTELQVQCNGSDAWHAGSDISDFLDLAEAGITAN
jgi:hypothetical protein